MYLVQQSTNSYDINKDVGVVYKFDIELRVSDILKICGPITIQQILGMFKYEDEKDTGINTRITFNKYENNQFNLDYEATATVRQYYRAGDNGLHPYKLELYNVDESNINLIPDYMRKLLPNNYCKKAPNFYIPDIEVRTIRELPEVKRCKIEGSYHLLSEVKYEDNWVWCNLPLELYKDIQMPAKRIHWMPQVEDFDCYTINRSALVDLIEDIAHNGLKVEVRIEVNYFGQFSNCVESGHRIVAAKYLQLPTIPAALILRRNYGYPYIAPKVVDAPQNPKILKMLNDFYNPEFIFNETSIEDIRKALNTSISGNFNELREEAREIMVKNFPNKIYDSFESIGLSCDTRIS